MRTTFTRFVPILVIVFLVACTKSDHSSPAPAADTTTITVNVRDVDSWSSTNTGLSAAAGATVYLYDSQSAVTANTPSYTKTTGSDGSINISVSYKSQYYIVVTKNSQSDIDGGYLVSGVFQSDNDVLQSPAQVNSAAGWPKFADINGDGKIDSKDEAAADVITPKQNQAVTYTAYIVQPAAAEQIALTNPVYPVISHSITNASLCEGSITATFTCPEKLWDATTHTLMFVDDSKTLRRVNGVFIDIGIGYMATYNLSGDVNIGTVSEGPVLTYSNVSTVNGTVTGTLSALIEPGACSSETDYKTSYVQNIGVQLCYSTLVNVFQVKGGTTYIGSNQIHIAQPGS